MNETTNAAVSAIWPLQISESVTRANRRPLTIALINNMSDSALRSTERQFCRLLQGASIGIHVNLRFYTPPQIVRSSAAREHVRRYYDDFDQLTDLAPDGVIVTGAEPQASDIRLDPCFQPISSLVDWVEECRIPTIWSCLAAHLAILHMDGIKRQALPKKLSGLFECVFSGRPNPILRGLPASWRVPHSRFNGIPEKELVQNGYSVISRSSHAGVDIFMRHGGALQLFLQGHPEYDANTLLSEYRRDVKRALANPGTYFPESPRACFTPTEARAIEALATRLRYANDMDAWSPLEKLIREAAPQNTWSSSAERLYANWLSYLDNRRLEEDRTSPRPFADFTQPVLAA